MKNTKLRKRIEQIERADRRIATDLLVLGKRKQRVKALDRKLRDQRVIRLGTQAWIAGVLGIEPAVLLGALLCAKPLLDDAAWHRAWRKAGQIAITDWEEDGERQARADAFKNGSAGNIERQRKMRTHQLATLGGAITAAGWAEENPQVLLGALLVIKRGGSDPARVIRWRAAATAKNAEILAAKAKRGTKSSEIGPSPQHAGTASMEKMNRSADSDSVGVRAALCPHKCTE